MLHSRPEGKMEKTWMPTVAGILDIAAGALSLIGFFFLFLGLLFFEASRSTELMPGVPANIVLAIFLVMGLFYLCIDVLAIVCGIYTLRRKKWGLALTGSIAAFFASWPLGIPAIVFTVMSKKEFE
jgi:hypothetical protein